MSETTPAAARLAKLASDAQTSAGFAGEAIKLSPDYADPSDAECHLENVEECMAEVLGGWTGAEFLVWQAAFILACRADENVQTQLAGINLGSIYLARASA